jgi:hypothetical protein
MKPGITTRDVPRIGIRIFAAPMHVSTLMSAAVQSGLMAYGVGLRLRRP